jgi:hypothetical protein
VNCKLESLRGPALSVSRFLVLGQMRRSGLMTRNCVNGIGMSAFSGVVLMALSGTALGQANVRAVHASPDAPTVNVTADGGVLFGNLSFRQASAYTPVTAGTYNVGVAVFPASSPNAYQENITVPGSGNVTVAAVGRLGVAGEFDLLPFIDDNTVNPNAARIRFIHASPNAPMVDITLDNGDLLFGDVSFRQSGGYTSVPGGTYNLQVRLQNGDVALSVPGVSVTNGSVITIFAMGLVGGSGAQALAAVPVVDVIPTPGAAALMAAAGLVAMRRRRA